MQKRVYRTYYTEFQNKKDNNNKDINTVNQNIDNVMNSNGFSSEGDNQFNNGIQKISDNLTIKLSPKREYGPYEICINSNFYENINEINKENNNTYNSSINNKSNSNYNYKRINNTLEQNFSTDKNSNKNINLNKNINNYTDIQNENENNNLEYDDKINYIQNKNNNNEEYDDNINDDLNNNIKSKINENNKESSSLNNNKSNTKIINSYEYIKNIQDENLNRTKNKNEYEENQFIDYLREAILHENKIESLKIDLSLRSDFIWEEVFRIFELEGRGFLSKEDLIIGFNKFGLYPKDSDISLLLKRYDLKKEGFISYPNFLKI